MNTTNLDDIFDFLIKQKSLFFEDFIIEFSKIILRKQRNFFSIFFKNSKCNLNL